MKLKKVYISLQRPLMFPRSSLYLSGPFIFVLFLHLSCFSYFHSSILIHFIFSFYLFRWMNIDFSNPDEMPLSPRGNKKGGGRKISYPVEIDDAIAQWFLIQRDEGLAVTI